MSQTKLTLDSLKVETFETGADPEGLMSTPTWETFATTGVYFCAVDCGSASECHNC